LGRYSQVQSDGNVDELDQSTPLKDSSSFTTRTYLSLLGLAITVPLLLVLGALLVHSVSVQRAQLENRLIQVLEAVGQ
jgi:hypothetical protein